MSFFFSSYPFGLGPSTTDGAYSRSTIRDCGSDLSETNASVTATSRTAMVKLTDKTKRRPRLVAFSPVIRTLTSLADVGICTVTGSTPGNPESTMDREVVIWHVVSSDATEGAAIASTRSTSPSHDASSALTNALALGYRDSGAHASARRMIVDRLTSKSGRRSRGAGGGVVSRAAMPALELSKGSRPVSMR